MFDNSLKNAISRIAEDHDIEPAALLAVVEVESGGKLGVRHKGRLEPLIRFEGHYFYRLLPRAKRNRAVVAGLAHRLAGHVRNPRFQAGRRDLLERAIRIDRTAALSSASWGIGQVMGAHWRWLGFANVEALVAEVRAGVEGQVRLMMRYIVKANLVKRLQAHDWAGFARAYNGPAYRRYKYDTRLARAWRKHAGLSARPGKAERLKRRNEMALLRLGSQGEEVRQLQRDLTVAGFPLVADGDFGPLTERALRAFQHSARLKVDGIMGPRTFEVLQRRLPKSAI